MKILKVYTKETNKHIFLFAKCKIRRIGYDTIYFRFPIKYKTYVNASFDPFAAALLLPSMAQGEDLIIHGTLSKKLYEGMQRIMGTVSQWDKGLKPIQVIAESTKSDKGAASGVATCFSGGVDSFYTWLKHKNDKTNPVTSMLCVNGFDIALHDKLLWSKTIKNVRTIAREEKAELIEVESNIRPLLDPILTWDMAHGGCLAAVGLCLSDGIGKMYIPSSYTADQQFPWGSHMDVDPNWSTETIRFVHDGTEASRVKKVDTQIAKSPTALGHLRVCYKNQKGSYNCGTCDKCVRTMINLYLAGVLNESKTFPKHIDNIVVKNMHIHGWDGVAFQAENLAELKKRKLNPELQSALENSIDNADLSHHESLSRRTFNRFIYLDHAYLHSAIYRTLLNLTGKKVTSSND